MSRYSVGDEVVSIENDVRFTVAGVDDDCVLRAEDGAWLHEAEVELAHVDPDPLHRLFAGSLGFAGAFDRDGRFGG